MNWTRKITPERYLENKEYFDQGLIEALENQKKKIERLENQNRIYAAKVEKDKHTITSLHTKLRDMDAKIHNLLKKYDEGNEEVNDLRKTLFSIYDIYDNAINERDKTISEQSEIIRQLNEKITEYERRERKQRLSDSTNTNNPTSTYRFGDAEKSEDQKEEIKRKPCNMRSATTKKKGGQPGHKPSRVSISDKCDHVYELHVKSVPAGAQPVYDGLGHILYYCVQVKTARFETETEEYHFVQDSNGITLHEETMKRFRINPVVYSNQLKALVLYLQSKGVVSLGRLCTILNEMSMGELNITEGTVVNWMKEFNEKSKDFRLYVLEMILKTWAVHVDETGYRIYGKTSWLHILCTDMFSYYVMTEKRKDTDRGPLKLLENFKNVLIHDHYKPYYDLDCFHGECSAHYPRSLIIQEVSSFPA